MFTQDDADRALDAVATYLNCEPGELRVVRGDEVHDLIHVTAIRGNNAGVGAWIYQCSTGRVYPVNGFEDPQTLLGIISESRVD